MLKFFATGHLSRYILIFFLMGFFWLPAFIKPVINNLTADPFFILLSRIVDVNIYLIIASAFVICIFSVLLINQLAADFEFSSRFSSMGMFFFVLLSSSNQAFFSLNPIIISNIFILFLLKNTFKLPTSTLTIPVAFNAGLLLGAASFFFPPLIILLFFLWGAIFIHRLSNWRNFVVSLIGTSIPYLFLFTWYLWTGSVIERVNYLLEEYFIIPKISFSEFSLNYLIFIILFFIIIYSALNTLSHLRAKNINLRRNLMITNLYLLFAIAIVAYYHIILETMLLIAVPATLLLTNFTYQSKKLKWFNIIIYMLIGLITVNLYLGLSSNFLNNY